MFAKSEFMDFPFVATLPKVEKSRLRKAWDMAQTISELVETDGNLIPVSLTCKLLDIGRTRIDQLCAQDRLRRHVIDGHVFITFASIKEFAMSDRARPGGRPPLVGNGSIFKNTPKNHC